MAQAAPSRSAVETITVTSSKLGVADVQSISIAITALSQEQLISTQTAGGSDLIKQVPNMTFTRKYGRGRRVRAGARRLEEAETRHSQMQLDEIALVRHLRKHALRQA